MGYTSSMTGVSYIDVQLKSHTLGVYRNDTSKPMRIVSVVAGIGVGAAGAVFTWGDRVTGTGKPITVKIRCGDASTNSYTTTRAIVAASGTRGTYPVRSNCENVTFTFTSDVVVSPGSQVTLYIDFSGESGAFIFNYGNEVLNVADAITYYTVSYNANGGSNPPASQTKASNANLTLTSSKPSVSKKLTLSFNANGGTVSVLSKQYDCQFVCWNTNSAGTGTNYNPGGIYSTNANVTLYARWGSASVTNLPTPTKSGSIFSGWFTSDGTQIKESSTISSDTSVTARWQATYTVTYNANGGSGAPSSQTKKQGESLILTSSQPTTSKNVKITLDPNEGIVNPTSITKQCSFLRWNTAPDGSGTNYTPGSVYNTDASVTLYAIWSSISVGELPEPQRVDCRFAGWYTAIDGGLLVTSSTTYLNDATVYARWNYVIKYDLNGGIVGDGVEAIDDDIKIHNRPLTLTNVIPTKLGLEFLGWDENKTATDPKYQAGSTYTENAPKVLYAIYGAQRHTVTFDLKGGSYDGLVPLVQKVPHGQDATLPGDPTKDQKVFKGWVGNYKNIQQDTTIYALWNGSPVWIVRTDKQWRSYVE